MLIAAQLLLSDQPGGVRLARGWVRVTDDRIAAVGEGDPPGRPDAGSESHLLSAGFVDTHLHVPQFDSIGADGLPLLRWLDQVIFPAETRWADADFAGEMAGRVSRRLLAAGTTGIAAYGTVHHAGSAAAYRALAESGLAGCFGQVLMDRSPEAPAELCRPASQLLKEAAAWAPLGRMRPAVTPRFAVCCTAELLAGAGKLAAATGWPVQTHLAETPDECELVERLFGGDRYVEVYRKAGLLGPRALLGHGIWLNDADRGLMASAGATVAHCPTANLFLQAGRMDLAAHLREGLSVSLGSDVAGGPDVCMVRVARAMIENVKQLRLNGLTDRRLPSPAAAWWQITEGNARAIGLAESGMIRAGAAADLVLIKPGDGAWMSAADPIGAVLYGWEERWIERVWVNGRMNRSGA
jgi:guanine deaminase